MSMEYWNERYRMGGNSGKGSRGKERKWKWSIIKKYVGDIRKCSVLDLGCGDLSFWGGVPPRKYIGVDYSREIIERNKTVLPNHKFIVHNIQWRQSMSDTLPFQADILLCLDVLFHQPQEDTFKGVLQYLNLQVGPELLFVTNFDEHIPNSPPHMSYRDLKDYLDILSNWRLIQTYDSPIDSKRMYVFIQETEQ